MSTENSTKVSSDAFVRRFVELIGSDQPAVIQRKLDIDYQSAKNYLGGRKPKAEVLEKIVEKTGVNLNWLLRGEGEMFPNKEKTPNFLDAFEQRVREIVAEMLRTERLPDVQNLGSIDDFDVEDAVRRFDDARTVVMLWCAYDHVQVPPIDAVDHFHWQQLTLKQKVEHVKYLRESHEEQEEFEEMSRHAPKNTKHS